MSDRFLKISDLSVDLRDRRVSRDGVDLDVRGLTYDLFAALIRRRGERATLQDLVDDVWDGEAVSNEVITQRVRLLRRALDDDPAQPRYIETQRQRGYRLCAPVQSVAREQGPDASPLIRWPRWGAAALLCAGVVLAMLMWPRADQHELDPLLERARAYAATGQNDDNLRAIDLFEQKLAASPGHYGATLGLSFAYSQRVCGHDRSPELVGRARALAEQLLAVAPADSEAISALAYAEDCAGHLEAALNGYMRAFELDPRQLDALASAAHLLQVKGELAAALEHNLFVEQHSGERAFRYVDIQIARCLELLTFSEAAGARYARTVRLYPDNLFAAVANVRYLLSRGRLVEADEAAQRSVRLGAGSSDLHLLQGELAFLLGRPSDAEVALKQAMASTQTNLWPDTARELLMPGALSDVQKRQRLDELEEQLAAGDGWPHTALHMAALYARLGDTRAALGALGTAVDLGYRDVAYLEASALFAELRDLEGYAQQRLRMRDAASADRDRVLAAAWWSPALIDPGAL